MPAGSRFKGYASFVVQDLVLRVHTLRYRRERWLKPDGETVTAALPAEVTGHFGSALGRFLLTQYHQGQVTVARLLDQVRAIGIDIFQRHLVRLLIDLLRVAPIERRRPRAAPFRSAVPGILHWAEPCE